MKANKKQAFVIFNIHRTILVYNATHAVAEIHCRVT